MQQPTRFASTTNSPDNHACIRIAALKAPWYSLPMQGTSPSARRSRLTAGFSKFSNA